MPTVLPGAIRAVSYTICSQGEAMKRGAPFRSFAPALERLNIGSVFDDEGWNVASKC